MHVGAFLRNHRATIARAAILLGAVLVAFEVGVRLLTPDTVWYEAQSTTNGNLDFTTSGTVTDAATIAPWRAAMTETPSGKFLWQSGGTCAPHSASYVFLWHGLPLEVVTSLPRCGDQYEITSGGIPDPRTYVVTHFAQP